MVKAVCECKNDSEDDLVVAVQKNRFSFINDWSIWVWIGVVLMAMLTGGFWLLVIVGYHFSDIFDPKYYCSQCERLVTSKQFRIQVKYKYFKITFYLYIKTTIIVIAQKLKGIINGKL